MVMAPMARPAKDPLHHLPQQVSLNLTVKSTRLGQKPAEACNIYLYLQQQEADADADERSF